MHPRRNRVLALVLCAAIVVPVAPSRAAGADGPQAIESGRVLVRAGESLAAASAGHAARAPKWKAIRPARGETVEGLVRRLSSDPNVADVEIEHRVYPAALPNDSLFGVQWGLHESAGGYDIDAPEAWEELASRGVTRRVVVAIVDSGVQLDHTDLAASLWTNDDEIPGNGVDDDGNGFVDDVHGWDFVDDDADASDVLGHGTHVAGIVAARGNNGTGVVGVSGPRNLIEIMPVRIFSGTSGGGTLEAASGIRYAVDNGAHVVNVSWGGPAPDRVLREAIDYAENRGVLVVCAAGNEARSNETFPFYPGAFSNRNIIVAAATTRDGRLSARSNRGGTTVDLGAPGVDIRSTTVGGTYVDMSGTSMAAAYVSGAVALVAARYPDEWWASWRHRVFRGVRAEPSLDGLVATGGILNLNGALGSMTPEGVINLAAGASHTRVSKVRVDALVFGASGMRIAVEGSEFGATELFAPSREIVLSSGDGTKTVSGLFTGEEGAPLLVSASIVLDTVAPEPPTIVQVDASSGSVLVSWRSSGSPDVLGYHVWVARGAADSFERYNDEPANGSSCEVAGLDNGVTYRFRVTAVDRAGNESPPSGEAECTPDLLVQRIAGANRYDTAAAISASSFATATAVVIATGEAFPDGAVASGLAGSLKAPLLLTSRTTLPASAVREIRRLKATSAVIVGGTTAVSDAIPKALRRAGVSVTRIAGSTRYETSAKVARAIAAAKGDSFVREAFVVRGDQYPDALSVAPLAYGRAMPVLLVRPDALPATTARAARDISLSRVFVVGGEKAVSSKRVMGRLGLPYVRTGGADRYETSAKVARLGLQRGWASARSVGVASGSSFPTALCGGVGVGAMSGVLLLTRSEAISPPAQKFVRERSADIRSLRVFGSKGTVSESVRSALLKAAR